MVSCLDCIHRVAQKLGKDECHLNPPTGDQGWGKVSPTDRACSKWEGIGVDMVVPPLAATGVLHPSSPVPKKKR